MAGPLAHNAARWGPQCNARQGATLLLLLQLAAAPSAADSTSLGSNKRCPSESALTEERALASVGLFPIYWLRHCVVLPLPNGGIQSEDGARHDRATKSKIEAELDV